MRDSGVVRVFAVFRDGRGGVLAEANADAGAEGCPGTSAGANEHWEQLAAELRPG